MLRLSLSIQPIVVKGQGVEGHKSPLEPNDHPELDLTPELDEDDTQKYQSLIGSSGLVL